MSHSQSKMNSKYLFTGNNVHNFSVNECYITWRWTQIIYGSFFNKRVKDVLIETKSVLSVKRLEVSQTCCNFDLKSDTSNATGFILRCATRKKSGHWTIQTWNVICQPSEVDDCISQIKFYRELANPNRPKSLLVFINPYGGKRQAEVIFYQTVRPIFDLAGIRSTVVVTSYQGHCQKYMLTEDIHSYDGVVTVGGDGLFSELLQGLLYRTRTDAKLPLYAQHKPFSKELTPRLRIGLIPAGSTNTVIHSVHGTENVETAALHIALGQDIGVDVLGIHDLSTKEFLRYTVSLLGYGFHGDILDPSERIRWLGPFRYDIVGAIEWLKLASYKCRIAYVPSISSTPLDTSMCAASCPVCLKFDSECEDGNQASESPQAKTDALVDKTADDRHTPLSKGGDDSSSPPKSCPPFAASSSCQPWHMCSEPPWDEINTANSEIGDFSESSGRSPWRVTAGRFVAVNAFLISCRCSKSPWGPAPSAHLGDGCLDLVLVRRCSRYQYFRYLLYLTERRKGKHAGHLRLPFVEAHRVCAFQLQALDRDGVPVASENIAAQGTSVWCVDGEVLRNPNIICCVHRQLIRIFGRGPEA